MYWPEDNLIVSYVAREAGRVAHPCSKLIDCWKVSTFPKIMRQIFCTFFKYKTSFLEIFLLYISIVLPLLTFTVMAQFNK